jgi:hypothetical protein
MKIFILSVMTPYSLVVKCLQDYTTSYPWKQQFALTQLKPLCQYFMYLINMIFGSYNYVIYFLFTVVSLHFAWEIKDCVCIIFQHRHDPNSFSFLAVICPTLEKGMRKLHQWRLRIPVLSNYERRITFKLWRLTYFDGCCQIWHMCVVIKRVILTAPATGLWK